MLHLTKTVTKGLATTKCGLENQSLFNVTVWWKDVTCPTCQPYEWVPASPVGKKLVRKKAASPATGASVSPPTTAAAKRRKIVRVAE